MDVPELYRTHYSTLVRYLTRLCGDRDLADDAAQEAFVRLAERPPAEERELRAWLFTVATNVVRDDRRTGRRRAEILAGDPEGASPAPPGPDPADDVVRTELRRRVRAALDALPERDRAVLLMREEGFKHREIADAVGITTGSVGTVIARALDRLAERLPRDLEDA